MTLQEALNGYEFVINAWEQSRARVASDDGKTAVIVDKLDDGRFDCWLMCSKTGRRLAGERVTMPEEVRPLIESLYRLRSRAGDCPLCHLPLSVTVSVGSRLQCSCGFEMETRDSLALVEEEVAV